MPAYRPYLFFTRFIFKETEAPTLPAFEALYFICGFITILPYSDRTDAV
ncbi:proline dehydrogenase [Neisseria meningitidis]|nr:proline dehydrogenase [Neisseria meningitidis]